MLGVKIAVAMSEPAWIVRWRARAALRGGQVEEAHRLLDQLIAAGNRRAFALRSEVVRTYLRRADQSLQRNDHDAAWNDHDAAERLARGEPDVIQLRERLVQAGLTDIHALLNAGNPLQALHAISRLKERQAAAPELPSLEEAAQDWVMAVEMAERGDFAMARTTVDRAIRGLPRPPAPLERFRSAMEAREDRFRTAWFDLQAATEAQDWRQMHQHASAILAVAPRHREAQQARNRAWQAGQPETVIFRAETSQSGHHLLSSVLESTRERPPETNALPKRFYLWVDGVGAWLVCTSPRITIGQASPDGGPIDVPLLADVSRIHAAITRDEECCVLETSRDVQVNGSPVNRTVLRHGDRLSIANCPMTFEQPVPGCLSSLLTVSGGQRLPCSVDGVLLMADMLVLGPGDKVHVKLPEVAQPVYLFRQRDRLGVRWQGEFVVEGEKCRDRALLPRQGTVSGPTFTFAIEPCGR